MKKTGEFSSLNVPLYGTQLIEASAGTGKTHAITDLFLRLIIEKNFSVDQILVVTFTEAATEELRDRIRKRLRQAIDVLSKYPKLIKNDDVAYGIAKDHTDRSSAIKSLRNAVSNFDDAAIYTIHSFCLQALRDHAFESGISFDPELITCQEHLLRETVDDFWRKHFYQGSGLFVSYAVNKKQSPDSMLSMVSRLSNNFCFKVVPETIFPDTEDAEPAFIRSYDKLSDVWPRVKEEVSGILMTHKGLNRVKYNTKSIPKWISSLDRYLSSKAVSMELPEKLEKFTSGSISDAAKKDNIPDHDFFGLCQELSDNASRLNDLFAGRLIALKASLFEYVKEELEKKKSAHNVQYFDDLLLKVNSSLAEDGGEIFARSIRRKYKAALIDEFQDTDMTQYLIFKKIFEHKDTDLILIGDPKQAIYSFRNADVFTYIKATDSVKTALNMSNNWRSEPGLIKAVNTLFSEHKKPFLYNRIKFTQTAPSESPRKELIIKGEKEPPFHLWFFRADKQAGRISQMAKNDIYMLVAKAVANETARLLNMAGDHKILIGDKILQAGDIAVLVRTHNQSRLIQKELSKRGVPCILHSTGCIFESDEARELWQILSGICSPNDERNVRAALITDIMGVTGESLYALLANETGWENRLIAFRDYHDLWIRDGFYRMFRQFMLKEKVKERVISIQGGERRLTNILHVAEALHRYSMETNSGMRWLLKWLSEQMDPATLKNDEHMLRLESDEDAVKIVTIHKSKGLEYPIVFCPFAWTSYRPEGSEVLYHDRNDEMKLKLDIGSADQSVPIEYASEEALAEQMRLLYVALTRARNRCYLVWGGFKGAEKSAPAYLFHNRDQQELDGVVRQTSEKFMGLCDDDIFATVKEYEGFSAGAITAYEVSDEKPVSYKQKAVRRLNLLSSRLFQKKVIQDWRVSSFSSLVSGHIHEPDFPGSDEFAFFSEHEHKEHANSYDIFSLPSGAKTGTMLHEILEHADFTDRDCRFTEKLISDKLYEHGFDLKWKDTLSAILKNVLSVQIDPAEKNFTLSEINSRDKVSELNFYFPLKSISKEMLQKIFSEYGDHRIKKNFPSQIGNLTFSPANGFMKGYIDLVFLNNSRFYLVDWKSNLLGTDPEDYRQENLLPVMEKSFYILQYHLYALALHQYLFFRVADYSYEKHFGGIYYIFLRGVDPALGPQYGIYRDRPAEAMIDEMKRQLIDQ